ncbi:MAG: PAS domain S-box protein [Burkholderiales bacterium]|nr:PAS domain S-box protein [Burkholderiales bacterium]
MIGRLLKSEKNAVATNALKSKLLSELEMRQEQLTATSDRMNAILQNAADAIITTTESGEIESFNHAAEQIFGYPEGGIVQHNIAQLASGFDLTNWRANESRSFAASTGIRSDGTSFPLEITASKITLLGQDKIIIIARDITARRKVERLQQEFVSTVSHELRTPLTAIRGALGLLAAGITGQFSDSTKRMLDIASANTERLTRLINDLLDVQKLESGVLALNLEKLSLPALIAEAVEANQAYAQRLGVSILPSAPIPEVMLEVDGGRFQQVMANLLSNAAKFSEKGDLVKLDVRQIDQTWIRIEVTDQGPGIPLEFRDRVFQKFAQADGSNTKSIGGSGLGLSIAKAIVNQMHGEIGFSTELGKGTCFYFELPIVKPT